MPMTLDQIRTEGLLALRERLGKAGMVRFLQQFESGSGDYATQRRTWVEQSTFADLKERLKQVRQTKKPRGKS